MDLPSVEAAIIFSASFVLPLSAVKPSSTDLVGTERPPALRAHPLVGDLQARGDLVVDDVLGRRAQVFDGVEGLLRDDADLLLAQDRQPGEARHDAEDGHGERRDAGRHAHVMGWDPIRRQVLLFGGSAATGIDFTDTWEWDGSTWAQRIPAATPPWSWPHALATNTVRQRVVLVGRGQTWEWNGTDWLLQTPTRSPQWSGWATFDAARQQVVLVDGASNTWEWDGANWEERERLTSPALEASVISYDEPRHRIVLFGVRQRIVLVWRGDLWLLLP